MFDDFFKEKELRMGKTKYAKLLGWHEFDDEGNKISVAINTLDVEIGYAVFRRGAEVQMIYWAPEIEDAVEWAVDRARQEIADHEIKQQKREASS